MTYSPRTRFRGSRPRFIQQWIQISVSPLGNVTTDLSGDIRALLQAQLGLADVTGYKCLWIRGEITVTPQAAPAAGTRDTAFVQIIKTDVGYPLTSQGADLTLANTGNQPAWFASFAQPFVAAPVAASFMVPTTKRFVTSRTWSCLLRDFNDTLRMTLHSGNAAQSWHVDGYMHLCWLQP